MAEESHLYKVVKKLPPGAFKSLLQGMERIFPMSFVKIFTFDKKIVYIILAMLVYQKEKIHWLLIF